MSKSFRLVTAAAAGLVSLCLACDSKTDECNKLAEIVNEGVEAMGKIQGGDPDDPTQRSKDARAMADLAEKTKTQIDGIGIKTEDLKPKATAYQEMMAEMGKVGGEFADLLDKAAAAGGPKLQAAEKAFNDSQAALQEGCKEQTPDCTKIAELVGKQPDAPADDQVATMLSQYGKDLGALQLEDEATKKIIADHKAAVETYATLMGEMSGIDKSLDAAGTKMDEIVAKEDKLVAELNQYCTGNANPPGCEPVRALSWFGRTA